MPIHKFAQTKEFATFVTRTKELCTFLEAHQSDNYKSFLSDTQRRLIELYKFAQTLPYFDYPDRDVKQIHITDADIKDLLFFIGSRLRDPFYWIVFDPTDHSDTASVCGDLIDDLGDIYIDIKIFLSGFHDPDEDVRQDALYHLKFSFDYHWNDHCINAIYAIHYLLKNSD